MTPIRDDAGHVVSLPGWSTCWSASRCAPRHAADRPQRRQLAVEPDHAPRVAAFDSVTSDVVARRLTPLTDGLGLEQVVVSGRIRCRGRMSRRRGHAHRLRTGHGLTVRFTTRRRQRCNRSTSTPENGSRLVAWARLSVRAGADVAPRRRNVRRARPRQTTAGSRRSTVPGRNQAGVVVGVVSTPRIATGGNDTCRPAR